MGQAKIFHNYPYFFMVVVSFALIQKALDEVLQSGQKIGRYFLIKCLMCKTLEQIYSISNFNVISSVPKMISQNVFNQLT